MSDESISSSKPPLPHDIPVLQGMVHELAGKLSKSEETIERLKHELLLLRHWRFGRKSEKLEECGQLSLFGDASPEQPSSEETPAAEPSASPVKTKKGHGRKPVPADLPVERMVIEPAPEDLVCRPCGADKVRIGEEIRRELDYVPGSIFVREIVRPVYACPKACEGQVVVAKNADAPIEKGLPGSGLLAHVVVQKYADHIPLNRQEAMLRRHGVDISRSTMAGWMAESAHLLLSFNEVMREEALRSLVIHVDETPVTVQDPKGRAKPHIGRIWAYIGDRKHPYTFYDYSPTRGAQWPEGILSGWNGFLQADAYPGFDSLLNGHGITEVACWAHARRKMVEAEKSNRLPALEALVHIRELYRVEKDIREECARNGYVLDDPGEKGDRAVELRRQIRQERSVPLLAAFGEWLNGNGRVILPKSPLGEAMSYCRKNWPALTVYATNGELSIDNNPAERMLRPVAVGRKNYLFFGSDKGGETAAALYSVIASAKRHGLDPWKYLRDLFTRLPAMTVSGLRAILPDRWKATKDGKS